MSTSTKAKLARAEMQKRCIETGGHQSVQVSKSPPQYRCKGCDKEMKG